jgi:predicted nucleic acid-binding protein
MIVVSNTGPLIALAKIDRLALLTRQGWRYVEALKGYAYYQ